MSSVEGRSITIEEAEAGRQKAVVTGVRERNPELFKRALAAVVAQKVAFAEMTQVKVELAGAVTPSQVCDVMAVLDLESNAILTAPKEAQTLAQGEQQAQAAAPKQPAPPLEATPKAQKAQVNATV